MASGLRFRGLGYKGSVLQGFQGVGVSALRVESLGGGGGGCVLGLRALQGVIIL